ncbi:MAG: universal stress protein [Phycisphaerae bacterium]|nr:universal stress protein [Phycisphaerae bacterium]
MVRVQRILLPIDFQKLSIRAAEYAAYLADVHGAEVHVVHVVTPAQIVPAAAETPDAPMISIAVPVDELLTQARQSLDRFIDAHLGRCKSRPAGEVLVGQPHVEISRYAADSHIDLIVIGTHAHGVVHRILLGSVSKAVLEHASCAVLMVPAAANPDVG